MLNVGRRYCYFTYKCRWWIQQTACSPVDQSLTPKHLSDTLDKVNG